MGVLNNYNNLHTKAQHPRALFADMWRLSAKKGCKFSNLVKVKAHATLADNPSQQQKDLHLVNDTADKYAKLGAELGLPTTVALKEVASIRSRWTRIFKGSLNILSHWPSPKELLGFQPARLVFLGPKQQVAKIKPLPSQHVEPRFSNGMWRCLACLARSSTWNGLNTKICDPRNVPPALVKLIRTPGHHGHILLCSNYEFSQAWVIWCSKCGGFSDGIKFVRLLEPCEPIGTCVLARGKQRFGPAALRSFHKSKHPGNKSVLENAWHFDQSAGATISSDP